MTPGRQSKLHRNLISRARAKRTAFLTQRYVHAAREDWSPKADMPGGPSLESICIITRE
jgi:hypothetical protein